MSTATKHAKYAKDAKDAKQNLTQEPDLEQKLSALIIQFLNQELSEEQVAGEFEILIQRQSTDDGDNGNSKTVGRERCRWQTAVVESDDNQEHAGSPQYSFSGCRDKQ